MPITAVMLLVLFRLGLWCSEAVGEWMIRFAQLYRASVRYRGDWRALIVASQPVTFTLWLIARISFLACYAPTVWAGRVLAAA